MEDAKLVDIRLAGQFGTFRPAGGDFNGPPMLNTPKKSNPDVEYAQWNMWGDERSRSNPAVRWNFLQCALYVFFITSRP
jgi:hypothetical protein